MTGDIDKVLEAEQTIATLVSELNRMKAAADLLNAAQEKSDVLLSASDQVIRLAGTFADEGAGIIQQLRSMDLDARLKDMRRQSAENQALMNMQLDRLNDTLAQLQKRNTEILLASEQVRKEVTQVVQEIGSQLGRFTRQAHVDLKKALQTVYQNQQVSLEQIHKAQSDQQEQMLQAQTSQLEQMRRAQIKQRDQIRKDRLPLLILTGANLILLIVLAVYLYSQ